MVRAVGSGVGGIGVSLTRAGRGGTKGSRQRAPKRDSRHDRPDGANRPRHDRPDGANRRGNWEVDSRSDLQLTAQREQAFQAALRSVAMQIMNDATADFDEVLGETEEDS